MVKFHIANPEMHVNTFLRYIFQDSVARFRFLLEHVVSSWSTFWSGLFIIGDATCFTFHPVPNMHAHTMEHRGSLRQTWFGSCFRSAKTIHPRCHER